MSEVIGGLIGCNIIALIILVLRVVLGKHLSKRFIYRMWLLVPLFLVLFPFVKVPVPAFLNDTAVSVRNLAEVAVQPTEDVQKMQNTPDTEGVNPDTAPLLTEERKEMAVATGQVAESTKEPVSKPVEKVSARTLVVRGYVLLVVLFLTVLLYTNIRFVLQCRRNRLYRDKSFGLGLAVYELSDISSPFLLGRSIYIPEQMTEEEMRYGTLHEEYHYRHKDNWWVIVRYLILALNFYSPIMWLAFKYSGYDCELACDEAVMARIHEGERRSYGRCLLHIMENSKYRGAGLLSTNMRSGKSLIKERIKIIASETKSSFSVMLVVVAFMLVLVSWMLLEKTTKVAASIEAANMAQTNVEEPYEKGQEELSHSIDIPDEHEGAEVSEQSRTIVLRPCRLGQYFSRLDTEPWLIEDENGVLFGYADGVHTDGGPEPEVLGPYFALNGTASSALASHGDYYYDGANAALPERESTWAEGVVGAGIGEYVEVQQLQEAYEENTIDGKLYFDEICIVTGNAKNEGVWRNNNRAKTLNFYFEDEYIGVIELEDTMLPQYFDISELDLCVLNGELANFRFEIVDVYDGDWYDVTCITGVDLKFREVR